MLAYTITSRTGKRNLRKTTLHLEGSATFCSEEKLHSIFFNAVENSDQLVINLERLTEFDYSLVMLLCATHKMAELFSKKISLQGGMPEVRGALAKAVCSSRQKGCIFVKSRPCILKENLAVFDDNLRQSG